MILLTTAAEAEDLNSQRCQERNCTRNLSESCTGKRPRGGKSCPNGTTMSNQGIVVDPLMLSHLYSMVWSLTTSGSKVYDDSNGL